MVSTAVLVDIVRTPSGCGRPGGALAHLHPATLLANPLLAVADCGSFDPARIGDVVVGCGAPFGEQGHNIARRASLAAGLPESVPAATIDLQSASSLRAIQVAASGVLAMDQGLVIAGGVDSFSRVPRWVDLREAESGRFALRHRYPEGLPDAVSAAQAVAGQYRLKRADLARWVAASHQRAAAAATAGFLRPILLPVPKPGGHGRTDADETVEWDAPPNSDTAVPADGAAAALVADAAVAAQLGLTCRARFVAFAASGGDPQSGFDGVVTVTRKILKCARLSATALDAIEVDEQFAATPLAWTREFAVDPDLVNGYGGALALGQVPGAAGLRMLAAAVARLEAEAGRYGLVVTSADDGVAHAVVIERL